MASRALRERRSRRSSGRILGIAAFISIILALMLVGAVALMALCSYWLQDLPDYRDPSAYDASEPTRLYASDGETLLAEFQLEWRDPVSLDQISPFAVEATISVEDERFYQHAGVDFIGIARAVLNNLAGGELEGASTITQQLVRNTVLSEEMDDISLKRKVREAYIALQLEKAYSKDEILNIYLNTINYGQGAYGIEAASLRYFSKHASDLTLSEAAVLAGIPQAPSYNNPLSHYEACIARRDLVLDRMSAAGYITQSEADEAKIEGIGLNPTEPSPHGIVAYPYFTSYVRNQLLNAEDGFTSAEVFEGGLSVITTLDVSLQEKAEEAARARLAGLPDAFEVSLVALDPETGYVKALVGGKDYDQSQVNMATGEGGVGRQAGSSFKTFTLLAAIEQGINPNTLIDAGPTAQLPGWTVSNIDKRNYGTRSIESAYHVSSNTAFARLTLSIGPEKVVDMAHRLGIDSPLSAVGSVTLGVDSVTPLEMACAYASIANGGVRFEPECVISVVDAQGRTLVDNSQPEGVRAVSPEVAHAAVEVMEGVIRQGTGVEARLSSDQPVAGKTGTSEKYKDSWFCGFTPQLSVAVWLGDRSDYASALSVPAGISAASVFSDFMNLALKDTAPEAFFDAEDPAYLPRYVDAKYHIGAHFSVGKDEVKDDEDEDEAPDGESADDAAGESSGPEEGDGEGGGADEGEPPAGSDEPADPVKPEAPEGFSPAGSGEGEQGAAAFPNAADSA